MLNKTSLDMDQTIKHLLNGRVVVLCIGNDLRGDDGVGPFIGSLLKPSPNMRVINCGETPENFLKDVVEFKPERVILIDGVKYGRKPGQLALFSRDDIVWGGISTHDGVLGLFIDGLQGQTGAEVVLLGIQVGDTQIGSQISQAVRQTAIRLAELINLNAR